MLHRKRVTGAPWARVYTPAMQLRVGLLTMSAIWCVAAALLGWPYLSDAWRRRLSLGASVLGVAFLLVAARTEGLRAVPTVGDYLLGQPYVLPYMTASASLPWYLLTIACLALGLTGLASGERVAETLRRRYLLSAVGLAAAVALMRFGLEKAAAPPWLARAFGVTWLAPVTGVFLLLNLAPGPRRLRRLLRELLLYALASRAVVLAVYVLASALRLGTHYDITPLQHVRLAYVERRFEVAAGSLGQLAALVLLPQALWIVYTLVAGTSAALLALGLRALVTPVAALPARAERPAPQDDGVQRPLEAASPRLEA